MIFILLLTLHISLSEYFKMIYIYLKIFELRIIFKKFLISDIDSDFVFEGNWERFDSILYVIT